MNEQIIQLLKTDPQFALKFALDNNFAAIKNALGNKGFIVSNEIEAFSKIWELLQSGKNDIVMYVLSVPYINTATNGTGGYANYFVANSAPPTAPDPANLQKTFNWSGLLTTIGIVLTGAGVAIGGTGAGATAETAAEKAAREAAEAEAAAKKKRNIIIGVSIGGLLVAGLIIYLIFKKKKS